MTIETDTYVSVVDAYRVTNKHESFRFQYVITRKRGPARLMVAGSASTQDEAIGRVREYLKKGAEEAALARATEEFLALGRRIA